MVGLAEAQAAAGAPGISGSNHGSAAVVRHGPHPTTAALLSSSGGAPASRSNASSADGVPSLLGTELSDDSLTMSPEEQRPMRLGSMKRDGGSRLPTGKRLALSQPRPARRESPTAQEGR